MRQARIQEQRSSGKKNSGRSDGFGVQSAKIGTTAFRLSIARFSDVTLIGLRTTPGTFGPRERQLLKDVCEAIDVPPEMVAKLLDLERNLMGMHRRSSIYTGIDRILRKEWRPLDELMRVKRTADADQENLPQ